MKELQQQYELDNSELGMPTVGRAVTDTLYVSPNGDNSDGSSWAKAFTTIQGALAVASTDADDCTAILVSPHATYYDIDTTGDPTYTGNYEIVGTHRIWAAIRNEHNNATSIFKFTGKVSLVNLALFSTDMELVVLLVVLSLRTTNLGSENVDSIQKLQLTLIHQSI